MAGAGAGGMSARILFGGVMHARLRPQRNVFNYRVFFLRFPISRIDSLRHPLFSINRWNLFSFHFCDHGAHDGSAPEAWIRGLLQREGIDEADGEIWLQAFPRMLGYVFNPVSFWLCHDRAGELRAVLCEVTNTFGEHHCYLLAHPDRRPIRIGEALEARKVFHVSPFCDVSGSYAFRFRVGEDASHIGIDYRDPEGALLLTSVWGEAKPYSTGNLLRAFFLYPWMTFGVIARIHYQALKLWWKGVPFFSKPAPPGQELSR